MPAMASPLTNLRGAVHGAEQLVHPGRAAALALLQLDGAERMSASMDICLPGMASGEAGGHLGHAFEPLRSR
jgi:hypothetical protein